MSDKDMINQAAVAFAFDHGPLYHAGQGQQDALDHMGDTLIEKLNCYGLEITVTEDIKTMKEALEWYAGNGKWAGRLAREALQSAGYNQEG